MNLSEIKRAIDSGLKVHWSNPAYTVIRDSLGQYFIGYNIGLKGENYIGLTNLDGEIEENESDFFIA